MSLFVEGMESTAVLANIALIVWISVFHAQGYNFPLRVRQ